MDIEKMKKEYREQDNRGTRYPTFVEVQERQWCCVIDDMYGETGEVEYEIVGDCDTCEEGGDWCEDCEEGDHGCLKEKMIDMCKHARYLTVGDSNLKDWYRCHNPKSHMFNKSIMKNVCDDCPLKTIEQETTGGNEDE